MVADEGGVDAEELGRATWTFLHTLAATHPATPSKAEVQRIERFMTEFAHVYPCAPCADDFQVWMKRNPVDATTGPRFARWMCRAHNEVNVKIGKPEFDCNLLHTRWGACESCARNQVEMDAFKKIAFGPPGFGKQAKSKQTEDQTH